MTSLLELSGKDLEREIDKIAKSSKPARKEWTEKEIDIVHRLRAKGVSNKDIAKAIGRKSVDYLIYRSPYYE
jgi:DNA-binding NarL/FixJ family response regulator